MGWVRDYEFVAILCNHEGVGGRFGIYPFSKKFGTVGSAVTSKKKSEQVAIKYRERNLFIKPPSVRGVT
jgi:hypothetical protein